MNERLKLIRNLSAAMLVITVASCAGCKRTGSATKAEKTASPTDAAAAPTGAAVSDSGTSGGAGAASAASGAAVEANNPAVVYERRRSELYDLAEAAEDEVNYLRHVENFQRTEHRLAQFTVALSAPDSEQFHAVLDRLNKYLRATMTDTRDVVGRARFLVDGRENIANDVMTGRASAEKARAAYRRLLAATGPISAFATADFQHVAGEMWQLFFAWNLYRWDWGSHEITIGDGITMPRFAPLRGVDASQMARESDWSDAEFLIVKNIKSSYLEGDLTGGDLFDVLAALRLCQRWLELDAQAEGATDDLLEILPAKYRNTTPQRIPFSAHKVTPSIKLENDPDWLKHVQEEVEIDEFADRQFTRNAIETDAEWLERMLEPKLLTYPWPWRRVTHVATAPAGTGSHE